MSLTASQRLSLYRKIKDHKTPNNIHFYTIWFEDIEPNDVIRIYPYKFFNFQWLSIDYPIKYRIGSLDNVPLSPDEEFLWGKRNPMTKQTNNAFQVGKLFDIFPLFSPYSTYLQFEPISLCRIYRETLTLRRCLWARFRFSVPFQIRERIVSQFINSNASEAVNGHDLEKDGIFSYLLEKVYDYYLSHGAHVKDINFSGPYYSNYYIRSTFRHWPSRSRFMKTHLENLKGHYHEYYTVLSDIYYSRIFPEL